MACTEPQCLYKGALYLYFYLYNKLYISLGLPSKQNNRVKWCHEAWRLVGIKQLINLARQSFLHALKMAWARPWHICIARLGSYWGLDERKKR